MKTVLRPAVKPLVLALALAGVDSAQAFQFSLTPEVKGSLDTTLSYGVSIRQGRRDPALAARDRGNPPAPPKIHGGPAHSSSTPIGRS